MSIVEVASSSSGFTFNYDNGGLSGVTPWIFLLWFIPALIIFLFAVRGDMLLIIPIIGIIFIFIILQFWIQHGTYEMNQTKDLIHRVNSQYEVKLSTSNEIMASELAGQGSSLKTVYFTNEKSATEHKGKIKMVKESDHTYRVTLLVNKKSSSNSDLVEYGTQNGIKTDDDDGKTKATN